MSRTRPLRTRPLCNAARKNKGLSGDVGRAAHVDNGCRPRGLQLTGSDIGSRVHHVSVLTAMCAACLRLRAAPPVSCISRHLRHGLGASRAYLTLIGLTSENCSFDRFNARLLRRGRGQDLEASGFVWKGSYSAVSSVVGNRGRRIEGPRC